MPCRIRPAARRHLFRAMDAGKSRHFRASIHGPLPGAPRRKRAIPAPFGLVPPNTQGITAGAAKNFTVEKKKKRVARAPCEGISRGELNSSLGQLPQVDAHFLFHRPAAKNFGTFSATSRRRPTRGVAETAETALTRPEPGQEGERSSPDCRQFSRAQGGRDHAHHIAHPRGQHPIRAMAAQIRWAIQRPTAGPLPKRGLRREPLSTAERRKPSGYSVRPPLTWMVWPVT